MRSITYRSRFSDGQVHELEGFPTGAPGLLVSGCPGADGFTIVHARSGCLVGCHFDDPEAALAAARVLTDLADWTLSGEDMRRYTGSYRWRRDVFDVVERYGGSVYGSDGGWRGIDNGVIA